MTASQLFVNLLKRTPDHSDVTVMENFLTEAVAGLLIEDPVFARDFVALLFESRRRSDRPGRLIAVSTQRSHYGPGKRRLRSQVDLQLEYAKGVIGVEVKIGAPEGRSADGRRQLESQCRLPTVQHVALISGYAMRGDYQTLGAKYLQPENTRGYFLWADVYPLLVAGAKRRVTPSLHRATIGLFRHLNFEPHHPSIGDLNDPDEHRRAENRKRFQGYWAETVRLLERIDAGPESPRSNGELYTFNQKRRAWKIWFDPRWVAGSLRVWCNVHRRSQVDEVIADIRRVVPSDRVLLLKPSQSRWPAVDVRIPFDTLFPRVGTTQSRGKRLASFLAPIIAAVG